MNVFEALREQVPIGRIVDPARGGKVRCVAPGHTDNRPSLHLYDDHVHCFACRFHGDVVDLWAAQKGFGRPIDAALDLAREFGIELHEAGAEARQLAQERREKEALHLEQATACHRALSRYPRVAGWWVDRGFGKELQERFLLGTNEDGTAAVIPFWRRGRVQGLILRRLDGDPKYRYPKAEEFPGGYRPLFIPGPMRADAFLVEGILDALALAALGESAVAAGGTGLSAEQWRELERFPGPLYILPDDDEPGRQAAREWARRLYPGALVCPPDYGQGRKDAADLIASEGTAAVKTLGDLRAAAVDALHLELAEVANASTSLGAYRAAKERVLPLLARLEDEGERDAALHDVSAKLKLSIKPLRKALASVLTQDAESAGAERPESAAPSPGTQRYERAIALLNDRRLLSKAAVEMKRLGHVGEFAAKKLAFICAVSARSGNPIQPSTHAQSSAGKNFLWDTVLGLMPPEMVVRRSGLSAKALFRTEADLKGAVLYIQEAAGSEDAAYSIRVMQSDGRLEYEATEKAPDGGMRNIVYQTEGPTVVVQTTTKNHLHPENETRVFPIYIDESERQSSRVVSSILKEASGGGLGEADRKELVLKWHDAIRLLEPEEVVIPYAERIEIPSSPLRIRRDARRLIDVVRVIAWLHQHQRERDAKGRILAAEEDFHEALRLVSESLRRAWQTLTPAEEKVLKAVRDLPEVQRSRNGFKRRELKVKEVSDRRVKEILKSLADTGYLECDGRQGPQGYTYTLVRDAEEISLGISLRPSPSSEGRPANDDDPNGGTAVAHHRPVPESAGDADVYRETGATGRIGHRSTEVVDLQEERSTGRTDVVPEEGGETVRGYDEKPLVASDLWEEV